MHPALITPLSHACPKPEQSPAPTPRPRAASVLRRVFSTTVNAELRLHLEPKDLVSFTAPFFGLIAICRTLYA